MVFFVYWMFKGAPKVKVVLQKHESNASMYVIKSYRTPTFTVATVVAKA